MLTINYPTRVTWRLVFCSLLILYILMINNNKKQGKNFEENYIFKRVNVFSKYFFQVGMILPFYDVNHMHIFVIIQNEIAN
jgi:hypothetical protein